MRSAVAAAAAGSGGVLLVTGEAGVGKSRLLAEVVAAARGCRLRVLHGRAVEGGGAYRPVAEALLRGGAGGVDPAAVPGPYRLALGRLLPGWAAGAAGEPEPGVDPVLVLGESVIRLLCGLAGEPGCVVVLEDLHWADADTFALLEYLKDLAAAAGLPGLAAAAEVVMFDQVIVGHGPRAVEASARALLERGTRLRLPDVQAASALAVALARAADGDPGGMEAALARLPPSAGLPGPAMLAPAVRALPLLLAHDLRTGLGLAASRPSAATSAHSGRHSPPRTRPWQSRRPARSPAGC